MREIRKILIIRLSSLGDIILASPLVRVLRNAYPAARIDFLVKSEYADLLKFNKHVSSVIELKSAERKELAELKRRIRGERYDAILDIHNSLRSRYLRWFSLSGCVRVINKRALARFFLVKTKRNFYRDKIPVAERYMETVKDLGITDDGMGLEVFVPGEAMSSVQALMIRYRLDRFDAVIGLAPAARHFTKRWPQEKFVELGEKCAKTFPTKIFIFGSRDDSDYCRDIAQMMNARLGSTVAESLAGKLTVLETAAALDFCSVVVSNDSGIMHLAASRKRKLVAVFGSTVREFGFFPYRTENIVVEKMNLGCRPCSHIGLQKCPEGHFRCMKDIQAAEVLTAMGKLMSATP